MIFYFTGTGNSRYIAKQIAAVTGETIVSINDKIKAGDTAPIETDGRVVFVTPTYAWRIPRIVENWIRAVEFDGADKAWFVMDCGSEVGNAAAYNARLCADKGPRDHRQSRACDRENRRRAQGGRPLCQAEKKCLRPLHERPCQSPLLPLYGEGKRIYSRPSVHRLRQMRGPLPTE